MTRKKMERKNGKKKDKVCTKKKTIRDEIFYSAHANLRCKGNKDDDLHSEPKMSMTVRPEKGTITFNKNNQNIPLAIRRFERKIRLNSMKV